MIAFSLNPRNASGDVLDRPFVDFQPSSTPYEAGRWMVVIFNNDVTPADEVVEMLIRITRCSENEAEIEMWEAHTFGKASVHFADREECEGMSLEFIQGGVESIATPEWED